jgi:hypothetical protein
VEGASCLGNRRPRNFISNGVEYIDVEWLHALVLELLHIFIKEITEYIDAERLHAPVL